MPVCRRVASKPATNLTSANCLAETFTLTLTGGIAEFSA